MLARLFRPLCKFVSNVNLDIRLYTTAVMDSDMLKRRLVLFDIDGTLTKPIHVIEPAVEEFLVTEVMPKFTIGLVGGSDFKKIAHQMGGENGEAFLWA